MNQSVLVVGGGPAGLSAARSLASIGRKVTLIEKEEILGGAPIISGYARLVPSGEWASEAIGRMVAAVESTSNVEVRTSSRITGFSGGQGDFNAIVSDGTEISVSSVVLATGFTHFDSVNKPEWGFGSHPDVVTTTQVEQMISSEMACAAFRTDANQVVWRFFFALVPATDKLGANGAQKFVAPCRPISRWKFGKNFQIAASISTIWIFVRTACMKVSSTGAVRKNSRLNTLRRELPK